jgi:ABC-type multidrug transport system fused ATPase/permease subunit
VEHILSLHWVGFAFFTFLFLYLFHFALLCCVQVERMLQLHLACEQRIGVIIAGPSGSGKSTLWQVSSHMRMRLNTHLEVRAISVQYNLWDLMQLDSCVAMTFQMACMLSECQFNWLAKLCIRCVCIPHLPVLPVAATHCTGAGAWS